MSLTEKQMESLDITRNLAVTAGAGSGKTKVLVDRFLQILKDEPDIMPSDILALTFTEKASNEMRERIRIQIEILSDELGGRWDGALEDLEEPSISTIHSFCTSVIRNDPLSIGYDPDIKVLTENEVSVMINDIIRKVFTRDGSISEQLRRLIVDYDQYHVRRMIRTLVDQRAKLPCDLNDSVLMEISLKNSSSLADSSIEAAEKDLVDIIASLKLLAGLNYDPNMADSGVRVMRGISGVLELVREGNDDRRSMMKEISASRDVLLNKSEGQRKASRLGNNKVWGMDHGDMKASVNELFSYAFIHRDALLFVEKEGLLSRSDSRIRDLIDVVSHVNGEYSREKRKVNGMDFDDQISLAMDIMEDTENNILEKLRRKYTHILIDEFQDTDPRQWRLAEMLWNNGDGSRLFLVGDPKQSIYGFRSADVRLFMKAREILEEHNMGKEVVLDKNFRSSSEVMDFVNTLFPKIMKDQESGWSVRFDPLDPHRGSGGSVNVVCVVGNERKEAREGKMAAEMIKRAVRGWQIDDGDQRRELRFSDIAILLPTRYGFEKYEDALRDASIPYSVYKGKGFFERSEVMDVLDMITFLTDQNDDIALLSVLKGPFFSLSDEELVRLSLDVPGRTYWEKLRKWRDLPNISKVLNETLDNIGPMGPSLLLSDLFEKTGLYASSGGRRQYRNLDKLLEWISDPSNGSTLPEVRDNLRMLIDEPPKEGESPVNIDEDAVTILTVHAAKGLEWPMVMVLGLNHEGRGNQGDIVNIDQTMGISMKVLDTTTGDIVATPAFRKMSDDKEEKEKEEKKRLLYVACTRARDHLVLSGVIPVDRRGNEQPPKGMMRLLKEGMELAMEDLEEREKKIGNVDVRLFSVKPEDPPALEEDDEEEDMGPISLISDPGTMIDDTGPVFSEKKGFISPTSEEVLTLIGTEKGDGYGGFKRELKIDGPAPDELGEMVHRALEGIPVERIVREFGYPDSKEKIVSMRDAISSKVEELKGLKQYREIEVVRGVEISGEEYWLKGRCDLVLEMEDGSLLVVDHKTGRKRKEHEAQLRAYQLMLEEITGRNVEVMVLTPE